MAEELNWRGAEVLANAERAIEAGMNETLIGAVTEAKHEVPKRTAILEGSIRMVPAKKEGGLYVGEFGSYNNNYAVHVEFGTAPHDIVPRFKKALFWKGADHPVKRVHHPGSKAHPFLQPAADHNFPNLADNIRKWLGRLAK